MMLLAQPIAGLWLIEPERAEDARGYFARTFCAETFGRRGLPTVWAQCSTSFNLKCHTLRGLHWQAAPHAESKLVRCTRGRIFDVAVDLRPGSATYLQWLGLELSADNGRKLCIPEGCAHGFLTLEADSEVFYQITTPFQPAASRGARWDDPAFRIRWPEMDGLTISERDKNYPDFQA
jgi:dTDP-4-dehydrorhamnose 3,5-epimerase